MRLLPLAVVLALALAGAACSARAQVSVPEPELPELEPPPAPPRIVSIYVEPEEPAPVEAPIAAEPTVPPRPQQPRPVPPTPQQPEPANPIGTPPPAPPPPALTLTPVPGTEAKTEASIRALLGQVTKNLGRVNSTGLSSDGRTQFDAARRFVQQAEDALKAKNLLYAGKLADKAAAMAAVLVR
jgi:hypothetical protein